MASINKKIGGFQGFIDQNGDKLDYFDTIEKILKTNEMKRQKRKETIQKKFPTYSYTASTSNNLYTGFTGNFDNLNTSIQPEKPKEKNKVIFNIEKIS